MVGPTRLTLARGVLAEKVGAMVLVIIPGHKEVVALEGPPAEVVNAILAGQPIRPDLEPEVHRLRVAGVISLPLSRRSVMRAGAIGAGAGFAVMAMPAVAVASSTRPVANTTRFAVDYADKNSDSSNYTQIDVGLSENGVYVRPPTISVGTPATLILADGDSFEGTYQATEAFVFPNLTLVRARVENLTHKMRFMLAGVLYEVTFTGPPW